MATGLRVEFNGARVFFTGALRNAGKCYFPTASSSFFFFWLFRGSPGAYGSSQPGAPIRDTAAGLHHSHSKPGSELFLPPTPQLTATPDQ